MKTYQKTDYGSNQKGYFLLFSGSKFLPRHGMKVKKLYTVFQLNQSHWITKYIKHIGPKCHCETDFEQHFQKNNEKCLSSKHNRKC